MSIVIRNLSSEEAIADKSERYISVGLHPWHIDAGWPQQFRLLTEIAQEERVMLIGEAGLDTLCKSDFVLQEAAFRQQAELAEKVQKPLIIHCVKAWQEIMAAHTQWRPSVAWIIHGFRGKPQLAEQLLQHGFYLSFGEKFNAESVLATPLERLCTETDESTLPIGEIYTRIAETKGVLVEKLIEKCNSLISYKECLIDIHAHAPRFDA